MKPDTVLLACSHKNVVPPLIFGKGTNWQPLTFFRRSSTHADFLSHPFSLGWATAGVLAASALLFPATAHGQSLQHCAPREKVIQRLASKYGETRQSIGLGSNNSVMEVFASVESGSWTITVTTANGITCLVASGQAFEAITEALPPKGGQL